MGGGYSLAFLAISTLFVLHFHELFNSYNLEINSILLAIFPVGSLRKNSFFTSPLLDETGQQTEFVAFVNLIKGNNMVVLSSLRYKVKGANIQLAPYSTINTAVTERYSSQVKTLKEAWLIIDSINSKLITIQSPEGKKNCFISPFYRMV